jgi:hypothetical protein
MAAPTGSATLISLTDALAQLYQNEVYPQTNRATVLARILPYVPGSGKNLAWDPEFGTAAPGDSVLAEGSDVTTFTDDPVVPAKLDWGDYQQSFAVTGKAMAAAQAAGNPAELASLFLEKLERTVRRLTKDINKHLYTGDGSASTIMGLTDSTNGALIATGTYAGIARGSYAAWAGNVLANGGVNRPLTMQLMRDLKRTIYVASGEMPDMIVCDPVRHEEYGKLFDPNRRYISDVTVRGQSIKLDGGYQALEFDGIPVIADVDCPANKMLFLNTRHVRLRQLPDGPSAGNRNGAMIQLHGTPESQFGAGSTGLMARMNLLNTTGDAYKVQIICYPQVQVTRPNACGILDDLLPA